MNKQTTCITIDPILKKEIFELLEKENRKFSTVVTGLLKNYLENQKNEIQK